MWDYARGRPAVEHKGYKAAVARANKGRWDPGWIRTWQDVEAVAAGCWMDEEAGCEVVNFFGLLRHYKGRWSGLPIELYDVQKYDWVMPLFGWMRPDGTRRFRRGDIWVPKKNGKTLICAGLILFLMAFDGEPGAQVYSAAVDREQAGLIYNDASRMVRAAPALRDRFKRVDSTKSIRHLKSNSFYKALSADVPSKEGLDIHALVFDEIHAVPNNRLFQTLYYADIAREQPLFINISTAGIYRKTSIGCREWDYTGKVMEGVVVDWEFLAYRAAADPEGDWTDPEVWKRANPAWGIIVDPKEIAGKFERGKLYPEEQSDFQRYRLNIWAQHVVKFLDIRRWIDLCGGDFKTTDRIPCWGGLDLSSKIDLTAFVMVMDLGDETWGVLARFWMPGDNIMAASIRDNVPYHTWVNDGWITATEGNVVDYRAVERQVLEDAERFGLREVGYDGWQANDVATRLTDGGVVMVEMRQGFRTLSAPTKKLQALVTAGRLRHGGNPVLTWMADNLSVKRDSNDNVKPDKEKSVAKIDGMVALVMALGRATAGGEGEKKSVYEERGVRMV